MDVTHRPLNKTKNLGIIGNIFNFIKNFLTDRSIQVKVGSAFSQKYTLDNGTAQSSTISSLLFLIMINDLPDLLDVESSLFADNSCVFKSGKNQCCCQDLFRSRDRDRDLDKMNSSALESRDHGLEITTLATSIPIGDRASTRLKVLQITVIVLQA